jgi:hypothetical protein
VPFMYKSTRFSATSLAMTACTSASPLACTWGLKSSSESPANPREKPASAVGAVRERGQSASTSRTAPGKREDRGRTCGRGDPVRREGRDRGRGGPRGGRGGAQGSPDAERRGATEGGGHGWCAFRSGERTPRTCGKIERKFATRRKKRTQKAPRAPPPSLPLALPPGARDAPLDASPRRASARRGTARSFRSFTRTDAMTTGTDLVANERSGKDILDENLWPGFDKFKVVQVRFARRARHPERRAVAHPLARDASPRNARASPSRTRHEARLRGFFSFHSPPSN